MYFNINFMSNNVVWIASFDIGKKNFSFYVEEINIEDLHLLTNIHKNERYNANGTPTEKFEKILEQIYKNGKKILLENVDLTDNCNPKLYLDPITMHNMTDLLDHYDEYWRQCDVFIIEKQMSFGKKHNTMALKLGQHCWSYFGIKYGRKCTIIEFPAFYKTQILGAEKQEQTTKRGVQKYKAVDKPARKKWAITQSLNILKTRDDSCTIQQIQTQKKKDDLADVICQLQAFKFCYYIEKMNFD